MKRVGLYGGTFDPIHFGHLNLAFELMEKAHLDEVWWIPTSGSPLKSSRCYVSASQRFDMVSLAIEEIPQFKVLDLEITQSPPTFTVDTVDRIIQSHRDKQFFFMAGKDILARFMEWKSPFELIEKISFLVGLRVGAQLPVFPKKIESFLSQAIIETSLLDISATHIRHRIKNRLYCGHLLPVKVLDFIYVNQLYFIV